jgi:hypothetical protein
MHDPELIEKFCVAIDAPEPVTDPALASVETLVDPVSAVNADGPMDRETTVDPTATTSV